MGREGTTMRRFMMIPLTGLLGLALAAPVSAGANVGNSSGSLTLAQGSWSIPNPETEADRQGSITVGQDSSGEAPFVQYSESSEAWVQCTGADTPDDPDDDTFGFVANYVEGFGTADLRVSRSFSSAQAEGVLQLFRSTFNECLGEKTAEELGSVPFALDLVSTSGVVRESGFGRFQIPGEYNAHSSYRAAYSEAAGTLELGATTIELTGQIGKVSWTDHVNG